jgi:hypothetical protein
MALNSYSALVTALEGWLNRTDISAQIPDFITLLESRLNRLLRVPQMEAQSTTSADSATVSLPTDFLQMREVVIDDEVVSAYNPQNLRTLFQSSSATTPMGYAVVGQTLLILPAPDTDNPVGVDMTYYQKIPALTSTSPTNWLLEDHPDIYLYGSLCMAKAYIQDPDQINQWKSAWDEAMAELEAHANKQRLPAGPLVTRSSVWE